MLECRIARLFRLLEHVDLSEEEELKKGAQFLDFLEVNILLSSDDFVEEDELVEEVEDLPW